MNSLLRELKESFILESSYEKVYLSDEDFNKLYIAAKDLKAGEHNPLDDYEYDPTNNKYYKELPVELTDSEFTQYISLRTLDVLKSIQSELIFLNQKQKTIKKVVVFWCVLTIVSLIIELIWGLYIYSSIYGFISNLIK